MRNLSYFECEVQKDAILGHAEITIAGIDIGCDFEQADEYLRLTWLKVGNIDVNGPDIDHPVIADYLKDLISQRI